MYAARIGSTIQAKAATPLSASFAPTILTIAARKGKRGQKEKEVRC